MLNNTSNTRMSACTTYIHSNNTYSLYSIMYTGVNVLFVKKTYVYNRIYYNINVLHLTL